MAYNSGMKFNIWVDADSVPKNLRPVILKAAVRLGCACTFVADRSLPDVKQFIADDTFRLRQEARASGITDDVELRSVRSRIRMDVVPSGADSADDHIVELAEASSLCITHDIPLASRLLEKGCTVLDDRGGEYTDSDIRVRLSERLVNGELRSWGVFADQQKKNDSSSQKAFSDAFDRAVTRLSRL